MIDFNLLDRVISNNSDKIRLYSVDVKKLMKGMGNIIGEIDKQYMEFLRFTNGISIFSVCLLGFKNKSLYPANIYDEMLNLWYKDPMLTERFWCFGGDEDDNYFGYLDKKDMKNNHFIGLYNNREKEIVYVISSSFEIFFNNFIRFVLKEIEYNNDLLFLNLEKFKDYNYSLQNDIELQLYLKENNGNIYNLY